MAKGILPNCQWTFRTYLCSCRIFKIEPLQKTLTLNHSKKNCGRISPRRGSRVNTGKNGYLNLATNYPQLWKEVEQIKSDINTFNISRNNLKNFKVKIANQLSIEDLSKGTIKDEINIKITNNRRETSMKDTHIYLECFYISTHQYVWRGFRLINDESYRK